MPIGLHVSGPHQSETVITELFRCINNMMSGTRPIVKSHCPYPASHNAIWKGKGSGRHAWQLPTKCCRPGRFVGFPLHTTWSQVFLQMSKIPFTLLQEPSSSPGPNYLRSAPTARPPAAGKRVSVTRPLSVGAGTPSTRRGFQVGTPCFDLALFSRQTSFLLGPNSALVWL